MKTENSADVSGPAKTSGGAGKNRALILTAVFMLALMAALFHQSLDSSMVHFSNDGPHGQMMPDFNRMPAIMTGIWCDLNWIGNESIMPAPSITTLLRLIFLNPQNYGRVLYPASMFIVALGACFFFKKLRLAPVACVLGGLAAGLNTEFLSTACWGVASQIVGFGCMYVALGFITDSSPKLRWARIILAGMALGMGIMEAYDIAALFSLVIAAYVLYEAFFLRNEKADEPAGKKLGIGFLRLAAVVVFSAFIATHSLNTLIGTQLKGVVGMAQDAETKEGHWQEATIWSLPKAEALQIFIPGIFGYRMNGENGENYWGTIGKQPYMDEAEKILNDPNAPDQYKKQAEGMLAGGTWRFSGTGYYEGVLVLLVAIWAALQAFRGDKSPFTANERKAIWFWTFFAVICVPLAFGKYAPFYRLWYSLPYTSVIRNPTKFMHIFTMVLLVLFAYGIHGLYKAYLSKSASKVRGQNPTFKGWWAIAPQFDRHWLVGCLVASGVGLFGWLVYSANKPKLMDYLKKVAIPGDLVPSVAAYSISSVLWFVGLMLLSTLLLALIFSGQFSGTRARYGCVALGVLLCFDLGRAARPWPSYWNVAYKYATNPVIDVLREKPFDSRVEMNPVRAPSEQMNVLAQLFDIEWQQQVLPFYNVPTLKMMMEPRVMEDKARFQRYFPPQGGTIPQMMRTWELTGARFLLGFGPEFHPGNSGPSFLEYMNQTFDPEKKRFKAAHFPDGHPVEFHIEVKNHPLDSSLAAYTAVPDPDGELGLMEFTGALPRASLFSNWEVNTNDDATLQKLSDLSFDVHQTAILDDADAPKPVAVNTRLLAPPGTVEINPNYRPKRIELDADVKVPSILMLTDRYNKNWKVKVDGKPAELLRCDFILRGTYLDKGKHNVVFTYEPPIGTLYVSLAGIVVAIGLILLLTFSKEPETV